MSDSHDKIIPTAWITAQLRSFSDIAFAQELFRELDKLRAERFPAVGDEALAPETAVHMEARYKLIDRVLGDNACDQVLELAAGFSGRGLSMAQNPSVTYVELDLPKVIVDKKSIVESIVKQANSVVPNNLYLEAGNATNLQSAVTAASHFDRRPIAVVNEGLLRYLTFDEKTMVANNVRALLEKYGGLWITCDITLKKALQEERSATGGADSIRKMTGIDLYKNCFDDEEHAKKYFEDLGYTIERHSFTEVKGELTSPKRLQLSEHDVNKVLEPRMVYVMRIKN